MKENVMTRQLLLVKGKISEKLMLEWENAKIIQPAGRTEEGNPFYLANTLDRINYVKKLMELGYGLNDIQKILRKVGLPKQIEENQKAIPFKKHLTIGGLARQVGVSKRTIKHWEEKKIIEPDMRSEGGFRLYSDIYIYLCKLIKDLQLFGYSLEQIKIISDHFRTFLALKKNIGDYSQEEAAEKIEDMLSEIDKLYEKIDQLKEGIQRWNDLLGKNKKEIQTLKKRNQKRLADNEKRKSPIPGDSQPGASGKEKSKEVKS